MELIVIWLVLGPLVGYLIGKPKGREGYGLLLGLLLGFIGWIIVAGMEPEAGYSNAGPQGPLRTCPYCAEQIQRAAVVCRYCGADLEPVVANPYRTLDTVPEGWCITVKDYEWLDRKYPSAVEDLLEACAEAGYPLFTWGELSSALTDVDRGRVSPEGAVARGGH